MRSLSARWSAPSTMSAATSICSIASVCRRFGSAPWSSPRGSEQRERWKISGVGGQFGRRSSQSGRRFRLAEWKMTHPHDPDGDIYPGMTADVSDRIAATPKNGGGSIERRPKPKDAEATPRNCLRRWREGNFGSHPDVYGRMAWDKPAPTIKRECAHVGNGRTPRKTVC